MKRLPSLIVALVLLLALSVPAVAADFDLSGMTDEELATLIDAAKMQLDSKAKRLEPGTVLVDTDEVTVSIWGFKLSGSLYIYPLIENKIERTIDMYFSEASVNGWTVDHHKSDTETLPYTKNKTGYLELDYLDKDADVNSLDEIETIRCKLRIYAENPGTWDDTLIEQPLVLVYSSESGITVQ